MMHVLAAEGGYQVFHLRGGEWCAPSRPVATALLAIVVGFVLVRGVLADDQGTHEDERDRQGDPRGRDGLPAAPVQDDRS